MKQPFRFLAVDGGGARCRLAGLAGNRNVSTDLDPLAPAQDFAAEPAA